jgi:hypothetical protein
VLRKRTFRTRVWRRGGCPEPECCASLAATRQSLAACGNRPFVRLHDEGPSKVHRTLLSRSGVPILIRVSGVSDARMRIGRRGWCPEPESNRYAPFTEATDFKSVVSTNFTTRALNCDCALYRVPRVLAHNGLRPSPVLRLLGLAYQFHHPGTELRLCTLPCAARIGTQRTTSVASPQTPRTGLPISPPGH